MGDLAAFTSRQLLILGRTWWMHSRHEQQFQVERYRKNVPTTIAGIESYLNGGMIQDIGLAAT